MDTARNKHDRHGEGQMKGFRKKSIGVDKEKQKVMKPGTVQ